MSDHTDVEGAFVHLMVSHQAALRAFVNALMSGHDQADDVIQEVNIAIWEKRGEFAIGTNFKAWTFTIARLKVLSHWRDAKRSRSWVCPPETLQKIMDQAESEGFDGGREREKALGQCLQRLRHEDRGLIMLRYQREMSLKKIAGEAGRSVNSLEVSLHRIRGVLRDCIRRKFRQAQQEV
ncbi:sigma-70 family RNA polymerase sigma factor [Verrucomicrobiaceae bacterium 227]